MAVLAVMAITMVVALVIGGVTVNALTTTSATRAATQAQAAAHAGIDATTVSLLNGTCPPGGRYPASVSDPLYEVQVWAWDPAINDFRDRCPDATTTKIKIVSTGTTSARGAAGTATGDKRKVEAIYAAGPPTGGGAALYSYAAGTLNDLQITSATGDADVQIKTGNASCTNGSIQGGIYTASGTINVASTCSVDGDLSSSLTARIAGIIGGSVTALGKVTLVNSGRVVGGVKTANDIADDNGRGCGAGDTNARAACYLGSTLVAWPSAPNAPTVRGPILYQQAGMSPPAVPDWKDYSYVPTTWSAALWAQAPWSDAWCSVDNTDAAAVTSYLNSLTSRTVINATGCSSGKLHFSSSAYLRLKLKTDIAFIAPSNMGIENVEVASFDGAPHQIAFITPDSGTSSPPMPSPTGCSVNINSGVKIVPPVAALIYTPCTIDNSANTWTGQLYAGKTNLSSNVKLAFVPVIMPGLDFGGAVTAPSAAVANVLENRVSFRDLDG
jgi:hypothetical protein